MARNSSFSFSQKNSSKNPINVDNSELVINSFEMKDLNQKFKLLDYFIISLEKGINKFEEKEIISTTMSKEEKINRRGIYMVYAEKWNTQISSNP